MVDIIAKMGKKSKTIRKVENVETQSNVLTLSDLQFCLDNMQIKMSPSDPPTGQKQTARTFKRETPQPNPQDQIDKARSMFKLTALISNAYDYPHENSPTLPYSFDNGIFRPREKIMALPDKPIFLGY